MVYEFEQPEDPQVLLEKLIKSLVSVPEETFVHVTESASTLILSIDVVPDDRGKIIGRGGSIIQSMKTIFHAIGCKHGRNIVLEIKE
jgi:predicted RNA-binding protein YlqC (UPF0109 family)